MGGAAGGPCAGPPGVGAGMGSDVPDATCPPSVPGDWCLAPPPRLLLEHRARFDPWGPSCCMGRGRGHPRDPGWQHPLAREPTSRGHPACPAHRPLSLCRVRGPSLGWATPQRTRPASHIQPVRAPPEEHKAWDSLLSRTAVASPRRSGSERLASPWPGASTSCGQTDTIRHSGDRQT